MADTANRSRAAVAECEGLLSPKYDAGTATRHYRAFWQRRCRAAHRATARRFGAQPTLCGGSWRGDPPERCLSRQAGIVRYCLIYFIYGCFFECPAIKMLVGSSAPPMIEIGFLLFLLHSPFPHNFRFSKHKFIFLPFCLKAD